MESCGNTDYAYHEQYEPKDENQYGAYYYNSVPPEAIQAPKSNYMYTHTQVFTSLAIDGQPQDTDIFMPDPPFDPGNCLGRKAPAPAFEDGWPVNLQQNYMAASMSTGPSILNIDINTPSASIDGSGRMSSYVVMTSPQSGTYSEHSNGHDSDGPLYSVPGDSDPWTAGSAFPADTEGMERGTIEEEVQSFMQHDPKGLLVGVGLSSPEPGTVIDPYQVAGNPTPITYQESLAHYHLFPQQQSFILPSRTRTQTMFDAPWTPVDQRMPLYPPGYVAFAPSPGPNVHIDVSYSGYGYGTVVPPDPPAPKPSSQSHGEVRTSSGRRKAVKGKETDQGWEHAVVAKGGLLTVSGEETRKPTGCRTGCLDQKTKEKAHRIRKMGACWNCWVQKVPCSEGEPCDKCSSVARKHSLANAHQLCWRSGFKEYESTFFPEFMHAHLRKSKIEDLVSDHTAGFLDTIITVEVSAGEVFRPMRLNTNTFAPSTAELLQQNYLLPAERPLTSQLVRVRSVPIGIMCLSPSDIKRKCKNYIEEMISNPQYADQATAGDMSQLPKQILKIVCAYAAAQKDVSLLRNALKLHAIHYFMSCLLTFTDRSAHDLFDELGWSATPQPYPHASSRLLNRQIKYVMHKLHREITLHVLEDLERSLRSRTKDSWGPSFCTILILCLCIEHLQSAADTMVVCDMQEKGAAASYTRDQSWSACEELEEYPFSQCKKLFHDIYRSHRDASHGGRGEKAFNPLRMAKDEGGMGLDRTTEAMVRAVSNVVCGFWTEIVELSERPAMINFGEHVEPDDIRANNTGRLVANFLRSFFQRSSNV